MLLFLIIMLDVYLISKITIMILMVKNRIALEELSFLNTKDFSKRSLEIFNHVVVNCCIIL